MRGVVDSRMALASAGALLALASAAVPASTAAAEEPQPPPTAVAAADPKPAQDDYYTRRAKTIIEAERSSGSTPHPLAASYPGMNVVVCEAGCRDAHGPEVVYVKPLAALKAESRMVSTSGSDRIAQASSSVACVAGCYDGSGSGPEPQAFAIGDWATTTVEAERPRDKLSPIR